jgi:lon-related putative ATP-dependent protease
MSEQHQTRPVSGAGATPIPPEKLRWTCEPGALGFERVDELPLIPGIIGQDRAIKALTLAFSVRSKGHNVFVSGPSGTGRTTTVRHLLDTLDTGRKAPCDIVYVNNFRDPDMPSAILLPAGRGQAFRRDMEEFVVSMKRSIAHIYESDAYKERTKQVTERFKEVEKDAIRQFEERIRQENFGLVQIQMGPFSKPEIAPLIAGEPVQMERLESLTMQDKFNKEEFQRLREKYAELRQLMEDTFKKVRDIKRKLRDELSHLEKEFGRPIISDALSDLKGEYPGDKIAEYLDQVRDQVLSNMGQFLDKDGEEGEEQSRPPVHEDERYRQYLANVVVDNTGVERPPVVVETSPNYRNLFGTIEKVVDRSGHWRSDFLHIKAGSVLRANGGFLVIHLLDAISETGVWQALKRTLKNQQIDIQSYDPFYLFSTSAIKPEPIRIDVRVAVIGDPQSYHILYNLDPDFPKIFKVKADFDSVMERDEGNVRRYAGFIASFCRQEGIRVMDKTGVAAVVEHGVRLAGRTSKLSTRFAEVADIVREANYWASDSEILTRGHVEQAIREKEARMRLPEEKLQELIATGVLLIDTEGARIGQINGLSYYDLGDYQFGKPTRITVQTAMGRAGLVNIEREAEMSGPTFNKAMLIIDGFFRAHFGQEFPLAFNASISFEQSYGGIEGDSASVAEVCAILSSLADLPLRQDLAVTGSCDQYGDAQPIGGVNEKIEGFFDVCRARGLTGGQGVVIPDQNLGDLMLRLEVVEAARNGQFHIHSIRRVEEAIELFTGVPAGRRQENGAFPPDTVYGRVEAKLRRYAEQMRAYAAAERRDPGAPEAEK